MAWPAPAYLLSNGSYVGSRKDKVVTILSGGNVDMCLLGQIVAKGLMQMGRLLKIFILLPDKPGALKSVVDGIMGAERQYSRSGA